LAEVRDVFTLLGEAAATDVKPDRWEFSLMMRRTGGTIDEWVRLSRGAINLLREQLLLWRTLPEEEKRKYWQV